MYSVNKMLTRIEVIQKYQHISEKYTVSTALPPISSDF